MHRLFGSRELLAIFFSALFTIVFTSGESFAKVCHIIVDPGHGGSDTGATRGDLRESKIVLGVASQLTELLKSNPKFKVTQTRWKDKLVGLDERSKMASEVKADLFLSIHVNSNPVEKAKGTEIYFQNQITADQEDLYLASRENEGVKSQKKKSGGEVDNIVDDLVHSHHLLMSFELAKSIYNVWPKPNTGLHIRQAPFHVLSEVTMPSVLVELGFLSNPIEGPWLAEPATQKHLAHVLYQALVKYQAKWYSH